MFAWFETNKKDYFRGEIAKSFMSLAFTQEEIEKELSDAVPHGMREGIARVTGLYPAVVAAWFNPSDERKSPMFTVLQIQAALDQLSPADGEDHWQRICVLREASRPHGVTKEPLCVDHEMGRLSKEIADIIVAKCEGKSPSEINREIDEAERQLERFRESVKQQNVERVH